MTGVKDSSTSIGRDGLPLQAFEPWYRAEYPRVVRALYLIGRDRELAIDAASEAFARALGRWEQVSTMESPGGWTYTVGLNVLRRSLRRGLLEHLILRRQPPPRPILQESCVELWDALAALPLRERTAAVLYYILDLPQHEVAQVMEVAPGTVAATLHVARQRLRAAIQLEPEENHHA